MRTQLLVSQPPCWTIWGKQPMSQQRHDEGMKTPSRFGWIVLIVVTLLLLIPATAISKGGNGNGGGGNGGGGSTTPTDVFDYGDVFGDLIHIQRDSLTGQPIFAQRWVEMPEALPGYGWGYCAIAVDEDGERIPFQPYSCDLDTTNAEAVEVDYFGRLNASRVQERNQRMHFNETITNIKQAVRLRLDPTGRLALGFVDPDDPIPEQPGCTLTSAPEVCVWATVDSPMENMALYQRFMKYGHIATDPEEPDLWWHGDPKLPIPAHPALGPDDFAKFENVGLYNWLPEMEVWDQDGNFTRDNYDECYDDKVNKDIVPCLPPEELTFEDFGTSADLLAAAGGKHNFFTVDLVQYLNRFLRITQNTDFAAATLATLPAQYEQCDCYFEGDPWTSGDEAPDGWNMLEDLPYVGCEVIDVDDTIENYDDFSNVRERFVNFEASHYVRAAIWNLDNRLATVALEATLKITQASDPTAINVQVADGASVESTPGTMSDIWLTVDEEPLIYWVEEVNQDYDVYGEQIHNFVDAASDTLRAIEFFHNYEVPENLFCTYMPDVYDCSLNDAD